MKKQNGFTLIELVVVIVILGILAVTAAPKFLNLQDDAKVSAVKGLSGAIKGAAGITYGKAAVVGQESLETGYITVNGVSTALTYGYPQANANSLGAVVDGLNTDWVENPTDTGSIIPKPDVSYGYNGFKCVVAYTEATATAPAKVEVKGSAEGCETTTSSN